MARAILVSFLLPGAAAAVDWALPMQREAEAVARSAKLDDPPQAPWPSPFQAFHHLARCETWGFDKRGYVKITRDS